LTWLVEDVLPEIRRTGDTPQAILKFARAQNLAPAQVETMGQLFNTIKTLAYLEKASSRGGDFPLLDVPQLMAEFFETPAEKPKQAAQVPVVDEVVAPGRLPEAFAGVTHIPVRWESTYEETPIAVKTAAARRAGWQEHETERVNRETLTQIQFDAQEDFYKTAAAIEQALREHPELDFRTAHAAAWALQGDALQPTIAKVARCLADRHWPVKLATAPLAQGLYRDPQHLVDKLVTAHDFLSLSEAAAARLKAAAFPPPSPEAASQAAAQPGAVESMLPKSEAGRSPLLDAFAFDEAGTSGKAKAPEPPRKDPFAGGKTPSKGGPAGAPSGNSSGFFEKLRTRIDELFHPVTEYAGKKLEGLDRVNNDEQRLLDTSFQDTEQVAMLQNLMLTDDVLSEADPDHVLAMFNTIRETAPSLARDPNIMRVALRTAVQHDGISPFDIKTLADTEAARQKTDLHHRQMNAHLYKGAPLSPPQQAKGV
jgi:hypothetical protein